MAQNLVRLTPSQQSTYNASIAKYFPKSAEAKRLGIGNYASSGSSGGSDGSSTNKVTYNTQTRKQMKPGESFYDPATKQTYKYGDVFNPSQYASIAKGVVTPESQKQNLAQFEAYQTPITNFSSDALIKSLYDEKGVLKDSLGISKADTDSKALIEQNYYKDIKDILEGRTTEAQSFKEAQRESGILEAQKKVADLSGQLNMITAQGQANQLSVVGQGRGIPEAIIGGQQAQMARETAIQALPVAAQLSAAQGNLEMAQQNLNMLYQIKSADAKSEFDFKMKLADKLYDFASAKQKSIIDTAAKMEERQYQEKQQEYQKAQTFVTKALENNQGALAGKIMALDSKSPTFKADLAKLTSQIYDPAKNLELQIKQAQLDKLKTESSEAPTVKTINGVDMQWNGSKWIPATTEVTTKKSEDSLSQLTFLSNTATQAINLSGKSGRGNLRQWLGKTFQGANKFTELQSLADTLKTNILTMQTDPSIKKFFGPQMSEADVRMMMSGGTTLDPERQNGKAFKDEATRVLNLIDRAKLAVEKGIEEEKTQNYFIITNNAIQTTDNPFVQAGITY